MLKEIRDYVEIAKRLDLVPNEADFTAAFFKSLLDEHGRINEEKVKKEALDRTNKLEKMAKQENKTLVA